MNRETKHSIKFANKEKLAKLEKVFDMYQHDLQLYINEILAGKMELAKFVSSKDLGVPGTLIKQSHWKSLLYKEASAMVKKQLRITKERTYKKYKKLYAKYKNEGRLQYFTSKKFRDLSINYLKRTKINIKKVSIPLDQRIVNVQKGNHYDYFLEITLPIENIKNKKQKYDHIKVPLKSYTYCNKYIQWKRSMTVKLTRNEHGMFACFCYEKEDAPKKESGKTVAIDLGYNKLITTDAGEIYGSELKPIYLKLANKLRGSKNYTQYLQYKRTEVNRVVNQFVKEQNLFTLCCEDLKELRKSSKLSHKKLNKQQYFTYAQALAKLDSLSQTEGFLLIKVNPAYTSQTCSKCGEKHKESRIGEDFKCVSCNMEMDADINAARNILQRGVYSPSSTKTDLIENFQ